MAKNFMAKNGFKIIDAELHVMEPVDLVGEVH